MITSYGSNNWLFTVRPRLGLTINNWLIYATGGAALARIQSDFLFSTNTISLQSKQVNDFKLGYVVGVGVEAGLTEHVSMKTEYLFENFNDIDAANRNQNIPAGQTFSNSVKFKSNIFRVGLNYHFHPQSVSLSSRSLQIPALLNTNEWESEIGVRAFASSGLDGAPQPLLDGEGMPLISVDF